MAAIVTLGTRNSIAAVGDITTGTYKHVNYKQKVVSIKPPLACSDYTIKQSYLDNNGLYHTLDCNAYRVGSKIVCTGADKTSGGCLYCECTNKASGDSFDSCGSGSTCNETGIKCTDTGMNITDVWTTPPTPGVITYDRPDYEYYFANCDDGWYKTTKSLLCAYGNPPATTNINDLVQCCEPCSGLKDFDPTSGTVTTFKNTGDTNRYGSGTGGEGYYSWKSVPSTSKTGIASCRGYLATPSGNKDVYGTYEVPYCEYIN